MGLQQTSWTMQKATKHGKGTIHKSIGTVLGELTRPSNSMAISHHGIADCRSTNVINGLKV